MCEKPTNDDDFKAKIMSFISEEIKDEQPYLPSAQLLHQKKQHRNLMYLMKKLRIG